MPSITETMRSVVPESTGKKDLRAEKDSAPTSESKAVEAGTSEAQVDQVELSESVIRAIEDATFDEAKVEALYSLSWKVTILWMRNVSPRICSTLSG